MPEQLEADLRGADEVVSAPARIIRTSVTANAVGAALVYLYLQFLAPGAYNPKGSFSDAVISMVVMAIYMVGSIVAVIRLLDPLVTRAAEVAGPAPATEEQRRLALGVPARVSWMVGAAWCGAAVVFGTLNVIFGNPATSVLRVGVGIVLGGLVTAALTATLVEAGMRPVLARVLEGDPSGGRGLASLAVRARVLRSWVLGSAVPLLVIGVTVVARRRDQSITVPVVFLAGLGLLVGLAFMANTASWISRPLNELRRAVEAVRAGDLSVEVAVDDAGEIGMLEVVVNDMVRSLRDQRRLEDLFGRHVGPDVARRALDQGVALGGTQLQVSVLFVDLIGSTSLAGRRAASEVVGVLNSLFGAVVDVVSEEAGWVNKFEGDGALCVFGAPASLDDHATRALRAARRLRGRLVQAAALEPDLDVAIGVATGTVVAGNVGALDRYEYTVIGDPVNEAARLTDLAKTIPSRLLASATCVVAADGEERRHWDGAGETVLRGRDRPTSLMTPADGAPAGVQPPATAGTIDTV
ncbi:MAG: adenylate/guanylate cyclase domain-containing protein [Acidimicrobiales bacterium]